MQFKQLILCKLGSSPETLSKWCHPTQILAAPIPCLSPLTLAALATHSFQSMLHPSKTDCSNCVYRLGGHMGRQGSWGDESAAVEDAVCGKVRKEAETSTFNIQEDIWKAWASRFTG